ncbi:hypothetical protein [Georgenia yuyongxinii]|uniref:Uncharacterized protein n=1 Tax=Georgenia yuyongxinii TaxID=2589797 RepID=A0A552WX41_9MICO|nr:hypothetical protein [Georgenia yuyongxinii]TRW47159.1 hypothetical protein FJ693_02710 [Georgenia yuyongxinii]
MVSYGFRLYTVSLRLRDGRKPVPFVENGDGSLWRYSDYLFKLLSENRNRREQGKPHVPPDLDGIDDPVELTRIEAEEAERVAERANRPVFYVTDVSRWGSHTFFTIRYGSPGDHDIATSVDDPSQDKQIRGLPPTRAYRACLVTPVSDSPEDIGILGVEVIGRACPANYLQMWTRWWASEASRAALIAADGEGDFPWWKMNLTAVGDDDTFKAYIQRAKPKEIRLTRQSSGTDGRPSGTDMRLTADVTSDAARRAVRQEIKRWKQAEVEGESISETSAAETVAAILGSEVEALDFDDVAIQLEDDEYGSRTLSPHHLSEVFTYRYADDERALDDQGFLGAVRYSVERLALPHKAQYDWTGWPPPRR